MYGFMLILIGLMGLALWRRRACLHDGIVLAAKMWAAVFFVLAAIWTVTAVLTIAALIT